MIPRHHPGEETVLAYSMGGLPPGAQLVMRVHLEFCAHCRTTQRFLDVLGGVLLSELAPETMPPQSLAYVLKAAEALSVEPPPRVVQRTPADVIAGLHHAPWRLFVPGVDLAQMNGEFDADEMVCLLRGKAGSAVPTHGHEQIERFVVLEGGFGLDETVYWPGDYIEADASVTHTPFIPKDGDCLCLFALQGGLVFPERP
jgi:putative transcriptional regulator